METVEPKSAPIIKLQKIGEFREGHFMRIREGQFGKLYDFIDSKGEPFTMAQQSDLIPKMQQIPYGTWTRIEFLKTTPTKGGNEMKVFLVQIDKSKNFHHQRQVGEEG